MKIKFKTFHPYEEHDYHRGKCLISAASALNRWLAESPNVEIISWQTTPVGTTNELYITIQYKEVEVVVDTPEHTKEYKTLEAMRLATMYVNEN